ncbi:hypothetical protein L6452_41145 [Arctium lappa]|uniref:Uncharacterized protein n=1 Tax=Arctium lappa TaxID=4217 RepID=A0ACB8XMX1_ARCLA|nr:hypothetical protein L6452_41145 [Arctium lappa]
MTYSNDRDDHLRATFRSADPETTLSSFNLHKLSISIVRNLFNNHTQFRRSFLTAIHRFEKRRNFVDFDCFLLDFFQLCIIYILVVLILFQQEEKEERIDSDLSI